MNQSAVIDQVVHEHTEMQEYLLQWEAALLQFDNREFAAWRQALEHLWALVPFLNRELPRHFRAEEEQLFSQVRTRHPETEPSLGVFCGEHAELGRHWKLYKQALLYCDAVGCSEPARQRGLELIGRLRQHIREEEGALLPLLEMT